MVFRFLRRLHSLWPRHDSASSRTHARFGEIENTLKTVLDYRRHKSRILAGGHPRIFFVIVASLCVPALGAVAAFKFMQTWNGFLRPLIAVRDQEINTWTRTAG